MKKLLLLSKGIEVFPEVVRSSKKVGFIPTAGDVFEDAFFIKRTYRQLKAWKYEIVDIDVHNLSRKRIIQLLNEVDVLFVAGGNTCYLLQELQAKDLKDIILQRMEEGMLYVGESAGAVVA